MPGEVQLIQLARILGLNAGTLTPDSARATIALRSAELADAFFREAAGSDDVTGIDAALDYLESRLADFSGLIPPDAVATIRGVFRDHLRAWA